jgi:hypothetical protein
MIKLEEHWSCKTLICSQTNNMVTVNVDTLGSNVVWPTAMRTSNLRYGNYCTVLVFPWVWRNPLPLYVN